MVVTLGQQHNIGEKPTVTLYTYLHESPCRDTKQRTKANQPQCCCCCLVVVFTLTDRASTIPSNIRGCQSGTWSQRGTKVNRSHHGDNPLLRPTGIQIATKSYATLQAMAPTNSKTVHQTSFTPYREQPRSTRIVVAYPRPAFSATNRTNTFQPVLVVHRYNIYPGRPSCVFPSVLVYSATVVVVPAKLF